MPPLWLMYPHISHYSIGWRMGYGEGYKDAFWEWFKTLSNEDQTAYKTLFPSPVFWREWWEDSYEEEDDDDDETDPYNCGIIPFWQKNGTMKYSRERISHQAKFDESDFIFFWKPSTNQADKASFGQWQPSFFQVDADEYVCAEQYMMAEKARLFDDEAIEAHIMQTHDPKQMKALGKKVKNFDQNVWNKAKYAIVLNGNYYKFTQNKPMRDFLLSTGDKILVEASPLDTIWGIGLSENDPKALHPSTWRGSNLLGFALMEVRDELRRLYQHYDRIDWETIHKRFD